MKRAKYDPLAAAARIVEDATVVDWSREPLTEYEALVREEMLAHFMATPLGWCEVVLMEGDCDEDAIGSDLRSAAAEALKRIEARLADYKQQDLQTAREAVARRFRSRAQ
jgi:hypothetical protein